MHTQLNTHAHAHTHTHIHTFDTPKFKHRRSAHLLRNCFRELRLQLLLDFSSLLPLQPLHRPQVLLLRGHLCYIAVKLVVVNRVKQVIS